MQSLIRDAKVDRETAQVTMKLFTYDFVARRSDELVQGVLIDIHCQFDEIRVQKTGGSQKAKCILKVADPQNVHDDAEDNEDDEESSANQICRCLS